MEYETGGEVNRDEGEYFVYFLYIAFYFYFVVGRA